MLVKKAKLMPQLNECVSERTPNGMLPADICNIPARNKGQHQLPTSAGKAIAVMNPAISSLPSGTFSGTRSSIPVEPDLSSEGTGSYPPVGRDIVNPVSCEPTRITSQLLSKLLSGAAVLVSCHSTQSRDLVTALCTLTMSLKTKDIL
eukprot:GEMP01022708.1.p4 GENE.GEMP01022708.1~~GEMP01022708.1.p4  ORF type:complete len:148 (-),score=34.43 GEMP01022708.1:51-494(-)